MSLLLETGRLSNKLTHGQDLHKLRSSQHCSSQAVSCKFGTTHKRSKKGQDLESQRWRPKKTLATPYAHATGTNHCATNLVTSGRVDLHLDTKRSQNKSAHLIIQKSFQKSLHMVSPKRHPLCLSNSTDRQHFFRPSVITNSSTKTAQTPMCQRPHLSTKRCHLCVVLSTMRQHQLPPPALLKRNKVFPEPCIK